MSAQVKRFVARAVFTIVSASLLSGTGSIIGAQGPEAARTTLALSAEALRAPIVSSESKLAAVTAGLDSSLAAVASAPDPAATIDALALRRRGATAEALQVQVQLVVEPDENSAVEATIMAFGGQVSGRSADGELLQAWVDPADLGVLAAAEGVRRVHRPYSAHPTQTTAATTSEGAAVTGAAAWQNAGYRGAGVRVAVIDLGFNGYEALLGEDLPANVTARSFVDDDPSMDGDTDHGTSCAEIIIDIAPDSSLYLVRIDTFIDLEEAVDWLIAEDVQVISTSLSFFNAGPGDGSGDLGELVARARAAGVLWVTAAGNEREAHWSGGFSDTDGDGFLNFASGSNVNYFGPGDGSGDAYIIPVGYLIAAYARWSDWSDVDQDYDLYIVRYNQSEQVWEIVGESATNQSGDPYTQTPTETAWIISTAYTVYGFAIYSANADTAQSVNFDVFTPDYPLDQRVAARSLSDLAAVPDSLAVAAVDSASPYAQEAYSSEGPTNGPGGTAEGGVPKPELAAYTNVSTTSAGKEAFNGTSAATPHVAGAAALVFNAFPDYTPDAVTAFLGSRAVDLGSAGADTQTGAGRLALGAAPSHGSETPAQDPIIYTYLPLLSGEE